MRPDSQYRTRIFYLFLLYFTIFAMIADFVLITCLRQTAYLSDDFGFQAFEPFEC